MPPVTPSSAQALVHTIQEALQPMERRLRQHAYLQALEEGRLTPSQLRYFVGEQSYIIPSDLRSTCPPYLPMCHAGQSAVFSHCARR